MISNTFKGAYQSEVGTQNQGINNISGGVKSAVAGVGLLASAATGGLSKLGGRLQGVGGMNVANVIQEKTETAMSKQKITNTISSTLSGNPINNNAMKQLSTVFDKLTQAKEEGIINKKGMIESNIGDIDPNSELGKKLLQEGINNDND